MEKQNYFSKPDIDGIDPAVFENSLQKANKSMKDKPFNDRRIRLDLMHASEKSIYDAVQEVEKVGADVRLTDAVILLQQAKDKVSDYLDEKGIDQSHTGNGFNNRMPKVGETVLFTPNPDDSVARSNGHEGPIAAIVTRVWSTVCVNLKIIPDHGPMQDRGSVSHKSANPAGYHFEFCN